MLEILRKYGPADFPSKEVDDEFKQVTAVAGGYTATY